MTRMTKEFSLVLLGSSLLTAGYFLWPDDDLEHHARQAAARQVGGGRGSHSHMPIFIHTSRFAGGGTTAAPSISRGGFGSTGHSATGVG